MIRFYKWQMLWWARFYQHIPGLRAYGRFLERHLKAHFWRTNIVLLVVSIGSTILQMHLYKRWIDRLERDTDPVNWKEQINTDLPI